MEDIEIIEVENRTDKSLLINFSDGTFAEFSVADLIRLQPNRSRGEGDVAAYGQNYL